MYGAPRTVNFILYCARWEAAVAFYRDALKLPVNMQKEWFIEFSLGRDARLSVADERRASIKSAGGAGVTVSLEVDDIEAVRSDVERQGLQPSEIRDHPWGALVFHLLDPEGHRLEFWQKTAP